jgi:hypothetical protein
MRTSPLAVVASAVSIVGLYAFVGLWWYETKPAEEAPPLDPEPVVFDTRSLTVRKQPFPLPPQSAEERPFQDVTPILAHETQPVLANTEDATVPTPEMQPLLANTEDSTEEILWAFKTEICACPTMLCIIDINDRYMSTLALAGELDPGRPETKELMSEAQDCLEAVRAKEQPPAVSREELMQRREMHRREIMRRELEGGE